MIELYPVFIFAQGLSQQSIVCQSCGHKSLKFDTFNFLPLEIRTSARTSLDECLRQFLRVETLDDYKCEKCNRRKARNKLDLYHMPPVLIVFFKR